MYDNVWTYVYRDTDCNETGIGGDVSQPRR
jgi:hypothetical protein